MYLARFDGPDGAVIQSMVRIEDRPPETGWQEAFARRAAALDSINEISSAIRVVARPREGVVRLISAAVPEQSEELMRRFLAGIAWLDSAEDELVELPADRGDFDAWSHSLPGRRFRLAPAPLSAYDCFLSSDFRIAPLLSDLISQATTLGFAVGYQANFAPYRPRPDALREVRYNALRLAQVTGLPEELARLQERVVERYRMAHMLVEEILAVEDEVACAWLERFFGQAASRYAANHQLGESPFELTPLDSDDEAALLMHATIVYGTQPAVAAACSEADSGELRRSLISWRPPTIRNGPHKPKKAPDRTDSFLLPRIEGLELPTAQPNHVFVSYKREDMPLIGPTLAWLHRAQIPIWYDAGIVGGTEWDAALENKIETARAVLVFLSQAAIESKYCRRELKYADARNKAIVVVTVGPVTMRHGLAFMLQQLQSINFADRDRDSKLLAALRHVLGY